MWIVQLALRRPVTIAVMAALMLLLGLVALVRMNFDIFPAIDVPVVDLVWNYPGLSAEEMEQRVVNITERAASTTMNGVEHIESTSLNGIGLVKFYFQPGSDTALAISQLTAVTGAIKNILPPGINPPSVIDYNATNVPILYLVYSSETMSQSQIYDFGANFGRLFLFTIPGLSSPAPFGGAARQVMVNIDPNRMYTRGVSPQDVVNALQLQNVIIPGGTAKIGNTEYNVVLNGSPPKVSELNQLPIKVVDGAPVYIGDVARVSDSHAVQTDVVRVNGRLATYMLILKHPAASTLTVVNAVKARLPQIAAIAPKGLNLSLLFDQSLFVRRALIDVLQEGLLAAALVGVMVLIFLGSWRSTLIVVTSIPLAILTSIIGLYLSHQTINIMTLGGLALAVGMLVDDATVEVENIHRNHAMGKELGVAILDGARQIAVPAFVGTLSICIVFSPVLGLSGVAKFLFTPLALAVVYAMLTSYLLSRTLVPSMAIRLLAEEHSEHHANNLFGRFTRGFEEWFERLRDRYGHALATTMEHRGLVLVCIGLIVIASVGLVDVVGEDFFPKVDTGMIRLHIRNPVGTRLEESSRILDGIEREIRSIIPQNEYEMMTDHIGLPVYWTLLFYQTDSLGPQDADLQIQLTEKHRPVAGYIAQIRDAVHRDFPEVIIYPQAADIISQVLSFGLSAPIDVQVVGPDLSNDFRVAEELEEQMQTVPGAADVRIAQVLNYPTLRVKVDRSKALELGITQHDVTNSILTSLSSSLVTAPNQWLDTKNGVSYSVAVQTPQHMVDSMQAIGRTPLTGEASSTVIQDSTIPAAQFLSNLSSISHEVQAQGINHYTVQRVVDVNCGIEGRDLGSVTAAVQKKINALKDLPRGTNVRILGESAAMRDSFASMGAGLILAIVLVYLLMATNFQSWLDPMIIMLAVPGALAGVLWMLIATRTTLNVESLMGTIMAVGVGVANGNLLITFANDLREQGHDPVSAAVQAGIVRMRPVIMTALAMILGMLPMSLAMGAGGEQNAPLGRAVIGGLIAATFMTLFVVPMVYSLFTHTRMGKKQRDAQIARLVEIAEKD
ncbi:MAG TPA: efflux RND transporter permease subunit [Candidatus Binataceae bacterium]|nr:efflux RND transporter permease subunit [Candidatus Binataceae bacterium]